LYVPSQLALALAVLHINFSEFLQVTLCELVSAGIAAPSVFALLQFGDEVLGRQSGASLGHSFG
jgi:hypothetical protein